MRRQRGFNGAPAIHKVKNRQEVETRRSLNTVPMNTGKRGVSENIEQR